VENFGKVIFLSYFVIFESN